MTAPLTATDLATTLVGRGVTVSNASYTGATVAAGKFSGGTGILDDQGFDSGIVLSSGNVANVIGPNQNDGISTTNNTPGDPDLSTLISSTTNDAAVLEFDFVPDSSTVAFKYVFASDEYNEFVYQYNDVFGFFVNGANCATVGGSQVSVDTVNNGNPFGTDPRYNPDLYRNNDLQDGGGSINTEMDGLTKVLTCQANVIPNATNHIKLAIADARDRSLDSVVFVGATTFQAGPATEQGLDAKKNNPPDPMSATTTDPINTLTGSYTYRHTDLAIQGRGPSVAFARTYNANDIRVGSLGPGWTHSYDVRLASPGDTTQDLYLVGPMGRADRYVRNPDGSYTPPPAVYTTLVKNGDGTYAAAHPDQTIWKFDFRGRLAHIADRYGNQSTLSYDPTTGRLTSISDPGRGASYVLTLTYDQASGRLTGLTDWASPARSVTYQYDANGRLWKVTDRENQTTTCSYDGTTQRLSAITDANNHTVVTMTYDAQGRVATQKDARGLATGEQTTLDYLVNGDGTRVTTVTYPATSLDPSWHPRVIDSYDAQGRLTMRVSKPTSNAADDVTERRGYDAAGNLAWTQDGRLNQTDLCYDADYTGAAVPGSRGNLTRRIDPAPASGTSRPVTLFKYDAKNNLIQTVSPRGVPSGATVTSQTDLSAINSQYATDSTYDASGAQLLSVTRRFTDPDLGPESATTKFEYTDLANPGLVTRITPPRGNTGPSPDYSYATTMAYFGPGSKAGLLAGTTDPLGNVTTYDYDSAGRRTVMVAPSGNAAGGVPSEHSWSYSYDNEDRLLVTLAPAPATGGSALRTEYRYDAVGNRTVVIDANGQVTKYAYDERDSLAEVHQSTSAWTDPNAVPSPDLVTAYQYDNAGNLSRVTRASGDSSSERATDYAYDGLGRVMTETQYPAWPATSPTLVTRYTYDPAGNRGTIVDPLGQTTTFSYDNLSRLTLVDYSDAGTPDAAYRYDADGNRTLMTDGTGSTSYIYDEAGRLTSLTSPGPKTVGYRYDLDGNRTRVIYPDNTAVTYSFDKGSRLSSLSDWTNRQVSYAYNPDGSLKAATNFNGTTASYSYDNALRLTQVWNQKGGSDVSKHSYTLDAVGNRTGLVETAAGQGGAPSAWGGNTYGQVGDGSTTNRTTSVQVSGLSQAASLAGGGSHSLALKGDGTLWAWGSNSYGQLGDGTTTSHTTPVQVSSLTGATRISAGGYHSLALKADGTVASWGWNYYGQLGDGSYTNRSAPVAVSGLSGVTAVSAGGYHSLALKGDGTVWAWGANDYGQLGDGTTTWRTTPVQVGGLSGVTAIAAGAYHSLALKSDGTVWAWGANGYGQIGGTTTRYCGFYSCTTTPVQASGLTGATAVASEGNHSLALKGDGTVWAWGSNSYGQVGNGTTTDRYTPVQVSNLSGVVAIAGGAYHSVALKGDGTLRAWGHNAYGELGDGTTTSRSTPVEVVGVTGMGRLASGWYHNLVGAAGQTTLGYGYDRLYRLTAVSGASSASYGYDPVGNRSTKGSTAYSYDRADRITAAGTTTYTVDANGNLTVRGTDSFTYDQANRLKTASVGGTSSTYLYDGDGKRASKTVGGTPTSYTYDVNASLPVLLDDGMRKYVWGLGLAFAVDASGSPIVYHADGLGSVRALTDSSGTVVQTYTYDEYGNVLSSTGSITQPFQYTGEVRDAETGFMYLWSRMYETQSGRFLQRDVAVGSTQLPMSLNRYGYVLGNPTRLSDPSGFLPPELEDLGKGWTARVDTVPGTDYYEIHVFNPQNGEAGLVSGRNGWIAKHGKPAARPAGIPEEVVNALNGMNVRELRARGQLPSAYRGFKYLKAGRVFGVLGTALGLLDGALEDARVMQRALKQGRSFGDQLTYELKEQNPQYLITPFGILDNPHYVPTVAS